MWVPGEVVVESDRKPQTRKEMTVDKASWLASHWLPYNVSQIFPYDSVSHAKKKLFTVGSSTEWLIITLVINFLNSEFRALWFLSQFIYIPFRAVKIEERQAFAEITENIEWNVSAWIIRPEKLIVPQWTRSVNRMCGRMSLNHALCLGGLHKQSSQWSCVSSPQAGLLSVRVRVCACVLFMSSTHTGRHSCVLSGYLLHSLVPTNS